ncbi:MAG: YncE family protein [Burkholderiales bacterium]|nr:YncE family protein [Burkholderiales bacterium]
MTPLRSRPSRLALLGEVLATGVMLAAVAAVLVPERSTPQPAAVTRFAGPTASQALALTADNAFLAVANADNNSVSFFDLRADRNRKLLEVPVQTEPSSVAFLPDGSKAYVANTVSGTVSMIRTNLANGVVARPVPIKVGTEPAALVLTPNGSKLYVANARSGSISVIDTATDAVVKTLFNIGTEPRGLAVSNNGDASDLDETLYVTQFLALPLPGKVDGADDAKAGRLTVISTGSDAVLGQVQLNPMADTGFKALGDALARIAPGDPGDPANFKFGTGAYPNQLAHVALKGGFAFLPNTGASPNGPVRFDVNTHGLVSVVNRSTLLDAGQTINLHRAVAQQAHPDKLFVTQPWAMAFKHGADEGYVLSAASNHLVKVALNPATGALTVANDPLDPSRVLQVKLGKNPRGIVINATDTRAYVLNFIARSVSVIDLGSVPEQVVATMQSARLPTPGTLADKVHIGKELYNTSIGEFDPPQGSSVPIVGRMSNRGWGSCAACHTPAGLSDNVVWIFGSGPRRTISQHTDFDQTVADRSVMRILNGSAERDEQEDFELNIRGVSGGQGLIVLADGITPDPAVFNLTPLASGARKQLTVRGVGAWDAIKAFQQFGIRAPISPVPATEPDVVAGRALFTAANCQACHGGPQWTSARVRFTPPPGAAVAINGGQVVGELRNVGTFDLAFFNEVRANAGPPLGASGFAPPSLLSIHAFPQVFLHGGAATSLPQVLNNVAHRSAGTGGVDTLSNPNDRERIARFLLSIDGATVPVAN